MQVKTSCSIHALVTVGFYRQENETGSQKTGTCTDDIEINPKPGNSYTTPASHCGCKVTGKYHVLAAPTTKSGNLQLISNTL